MYSLIHLTFVLGCVLRIPGQNVLSARTRCLCSGTREMEKIERSKAACLSQTTWIIWFQFSISISIRAEHVRRSANEMMGRNMNARLTYQAGETKMIVMSWWHVGSKGEIENKFELIVLNCASRTHLSLAASSDWLSYIVSPPIVLAHIWITYQGAVHWHLCCLRLRHWPTWHLGLFYSSLSPYLFISNSCKHYYVVNELLTQKKILYSFPHTRAHTALFTPARTIYNRNDTSATTNPIALCRSSSQVGKRNRVTTCYKIQKWNKLNAMCTPLTVEHLHACVSLAAAFGEQQRKKKFRQTRRKMWIN